MKKNKYLTIYSVFVSLIFLGTIIFLGLSLYQEYSGGYVRSRKTFDSMSSSVKTTLQHTSEYSTEIKSKIENNIGSLDDYAFIDIQKNGKSIYTYSISDLIPNENTKMIKLYNNTTRIGGDTIYITAEMYTLRPTTIAKNAKIAFVIILIFTLITVILLICINISGGNEEEPVTEKNDYQIQELKEQQVINKEENQKPEILKQSINIVNNVNSKPKDDTTIAEKTETASDETVAIKTPQISDDVKLNFDADDDSNDEIDDEELQDDELDDNLEIEDEDLQDTLEFEEDLPLDDDEDIELDDSDEIEDDFQADDDLDLEEDLNIDNDDNADVELAGSDNIEDDLQTDDELDLEEDLDIDNDDDIEVDDSDEIENAPQTDDELDIDSDDDIDGENIQLNDDEIENDLPLNDDSEFEEDSSIFNEDEKNDTLELNEDLPLDDNDPDIESESINELPSDDEIEDIGDLPINDDELDIDIETENIDDLPLNDDELELDNLPLNDDEIEPDGEDIDNLPLSDDEIELDDNTETPEIDDNLNYIEKLHFDNDNLDDKTKYLNINDNLDFEETPINEENLDLEVEAKEIERDLTLEEDGIATDEIERDFQLEEDSIDSEETERDFKPEQKRIDTNEKYIMKKDVDLNEGDITDENADNANPYGLFSPKTGFGWEPYLMPRLENELVRASSLEFDLVLVLIKLKNVGRQTKTMKTIATMLIDSFQFKDLIFEYKDDCFAAIRTNCTIDEAIPLADRLHANISKELSGIGGECFIGMTSKTIRLVSGERLLKEAESALEHAEKDETSPIIAFRVNAEKYRDFVDKTN